MEKELIIVLDFGGQYKQLIARRVRECNVYCEIHPYSKTPGEILAMHPKGIILTGGPNSVYAEDSPTCDRALFGLGIPVLGICYGSQLMAHKLGGAVKTAPVSEYGHTKIELDGVESGSKLFKGISTAENTCWMSHTDYIANPPRGFKITAHTENCPVAAMENPGSRLYAVQFHPEVVHTPFGTQLLRNFVMDICGFRRRGFLCGGGFAFQGCRQAAHLRVRGPRTSSKR